MCVKQVPTAVETTGAIQPGDVILSVNGIPLPGPRSYENDEALLKAPGMFPMRLRIERPKQSAATPEVGYVPELSQGAPPGGGVWGSGRGAGLEGSLSRLKQVRTHDPPPTNTQTYAFLLMLNRSTLFLEMFSFLAPFLNSIESSEKPDEGGGVLFVLTPLLPLAVPVYGKSHLAEYGSTG